VKISAILYISYDGLLEPLGQSQVLNYLCELSEGHRIYLISYEKASDWGKVAHRNSTKQKLKEHDIRWSPLRYHKRPSALATSYDLLLGMVLSFWLCIRYRINLVHARSYPPSVIALVMKMMFGCRFIFDMRGFWADERVDGGLWQTQGRLYRIAKWFEQRFLLNADLVVSLTHAAVTEMRQFPYLQGSMPKFEVITTCTDLDLFKPDFSKCTSLQMQQPFTLGYVGSVGVWYLFDETLKCFKLLQERVPNARLHILNRGSHSYINERLTLHGIDLKSVLVETADHVGVANAMQQMDAGIFFIKPVYSKTASAPTKLGEFLGCGVPCLGNSGVGDMASILENEKVGVALYSFSQPSMEEAIDQLLKLANDPEIQERCRQVALKFFSLDEGVKTYDKIYSELAVSSL